VLIKSIERSQSTKRQALQIYLEGLGFRSIGRILNVSHVSVYHWIRKFGAQVETVRNDKPVEVMELDELHTYIGRKKLPTVLDLYQSKRPAVR
jgi:transposase